MSDAIGTVRSYDEIQALMRLRADALNLSRETIDELAGVPRGYASKALAAVPMRKLGPDTLGPMLGALGLKMVVVEDAEAMAKHTARGAARDSRYAIHGGAVEFKVSKRKLKRIGRIGGKNSRKYMTKKKATKLARHANRMRWHKPEVVEITNVPTVDILSVTDV